MHWERQPLKTLARVDALFVGGGNTYALLDRVRSAGLIEPIQERARDGMPYAGTSAGANLAGPTILTTNDWNVVALAHFGALHLVPFNINPHYKDADPAMAPGSETREDRIREYHVRNKNAVVAIEEETMVRVEDGVATVLGQRRVKLFRVGKAPRVVRRRRAARRCEARQPRRDREPRHRRLDPRHRRRRQPVPRAPQHASALPQGVVCQLMDASELADDDLVAVVSNMGAPLVGQERLTDPKTMALAITMMEEYLGRKFRAVMSLEIGGGNSIQPFMAPR